MHFKRVCILKFQMCCMENHSYWQDSEIHVPRSSVAMCCLLVAKNITDVQLTSGKGGKYC